MLRSRVNLIIFDQPFWFEKKYVSKQMCRILPCPLALCEFELKKKKSSGYWIIIQFPEQKHLYGKSNVMSSC